MELTRKNSIWLVSTTIIYLVITALSFNNCYFWDNILQTSVEAHWYYWGNFHSLFITPGTFEGITATGYHPPLMGMMTALLWKIFGYNLWVSHAFILFWAVILFYQVRKLIDHFIDEKFQGVVFAIVLLESAVLTQYSFASPDFILLTAFVMSVRAILERKKILLAIGIFFLCCINMRGVFAGVLFFLAHNYYEFLLSGKRFSFKLLLQTITSYIPTLLILIIYYFAIILKNGWFIDNSQSWHYAMPETIGRVVKHAAEFSLRTLENGRFIIWIFGISGVYKLLKSKQLQDPKLQFIVLTAALLAGLYIIFIFITQMPFNSRYFMPIFLLITLIAAIYISKMEPKKTWILFSLFLLFELTGNLWIYPEKIAKSWDSTLAHIPYFELRKECLDYIENNKINYGELAAGFTIYGDRRFVDLYHEKKNISGDADKCTYFIQSNISNNDDKFVAELQETDKWLPVKHFQKGFIYITIFKRANIHADE